MQLFSDNELLDALKEGSSEAFTEIYNRYWAKLLRVAMRKTNSRETAEELVQNLFVSIWQKREVLFIKDLNFYLFSALRFSFIDYLESKAVQQRFSAYYQSYVSFTDNSTEESLALSDLTEDIARTLLGVPEKSRQIFEMSRFEHLTIPEIAARMNLSEKTVEYHLGNSLKALREHLGELLVFSFYFLR